MFGASFELASVMEFGFNKNVTLLLTLSVVQETRSCLIYVSWVTISVGFPC